MSRKKDKERVNAHIRMCDRIIQDEMNPKFREQVEEHQGMLIAGQTFSPMKSRTKFIENTNKLIDSGKKIKEKKQQLEDECSKGDNIACAELEVADCIHCDDPVDLLLDLATDDTFAECFDEAIPREKVVRDERKYNVNETIIKNIQDKTAKKQDISQRFLESQDPIVRMIAQKYLKKKVE